MATANVAIAEKVTEAISARDVDGLVSMASDDIEFVPLRAALEGTSYHGKEGVVRLMREVAETWAEFRIEVEEVREVAPGSVLGFATVHSRGHRSDVTTQMAVGLVARIRDGLVTYAAMYPDRAEAERAAAMPYR